VPAIVKRVGVRHECQYSTNRRFISHSKLKEKNMAFKIGAVVQLNSGGPIMTVTHLGKLPDSTQNVTCSWFDERKEEKGTYPEAALHEYKEKGSSEGESDD
jgi:uncharacterized protein YodC (DUF2158 family)